MRPRLLLGLAVLLALGAVVVTCLYLTVPKGNEGSGPVDAIIVLGTPASLHGELTDMQRWRADEGIREFRAGRAPRIVFSGGAAANEFVESRVMGAYARDQGVPASAVLEEQHSRTTIQNIANSAALVKAQGWHRVEVISTAEHLHRAAVLLERTGLQWRTHAAPTPGRSRPQIALAYVEEAVGTSVFRTFGPRAEPVLHAFAYAQHRVAYGIRWVLYKLEGKI